jgi:hypothetical protein
MYVPLFGSWTTTLTSGTVLKRQNTVVPVAIVDLILAEMQHFAQMALFTPIKVRLVHRCFQRHRHGLCLHKLFFDSFEHLDIATLMS